jgi:chemotaxis protein CheD
MAECRIVAFEKNSGVSCLSTYALGSCIAVVMYDWKFRLGGLLHVMLPDSSIDKERSDANPFAYADTGVSEMLRRLQALGSSRRRTRCCIAGGACMMADSSLFEIGKRNQIAVREALAGLGVYIDREDVGGTASRSVRLDLETGQVDVRTGTGRSQVLMPPGIALGGGSRDLSPNLPEHGSS